MGNLGAGERSRNMRIDVIKYRIKTSISQYCVNLCVNYGSQGNL